MPHASRGLSVSAARPGPDPILGNVGWSAPHFDCLPRDRKMQREACMGEHRWKVDSRGLQHGVQAGDGPADSHR